MMLSHTGIKFVQECFEQYIILIERAIPQKTRKLIRGRKFKTLVVLTMVQFILYLGTLAYFVVSEH